MGMGQVGSVARIARPRASTRAFRMSLIASTAILSLSLSVGAVLAPLECAYAQTEVTNFNIPAQSLRSALLMYSAQSKVQVAIPDELVEGKNAPAVSGALSNEEALGRLLSENGISFEFVGVRAARLMATQKKTNSPTSAKFGVLAAPVSSLSGSRAEAPEELVVTGSRIRGAGPVGSEVVVLQRSQIEATGLATAAEVIRTLPQTTAIGANDDRFRSSASTINSEAGSSVNLRGLGADATLTLLNGHRIAPSGNGTFVDISAIPLAALERIEVVLDGASAIYGSDAIGGVVNFVLRRSYDGAETSGRAGIGDGFRQFSASQTVGRSWEGGSLLGTYEYYHRTRLAASKRDYATNDLRGFGGTDFRRTNSNPGNISANGTTYAIPPSQNGVGIRPSGLVAGTVNLQDEWQGADLLPDQERHSALLSLSQEVTPSVRLFGDGLYSRRQFVTNTPATPITLTVPSSNPFFVSPVAGARTVSVLYSLIDDLGPLRQQGTAVNYSFTGGAEAQLPNKWRAELSGTLSADELHYNYFGFPQIQRLNTALADTNPATAFNPFADGGATNPATLALISAPYRSRTGYRVRSLNAEASGPLFSLPGGDVRLALGGEYRSERFEFFTLSYSTSLSGSISAQAGNRRVKAAFGELLVPIVGNENALPLLQKLQLSFAGRWEKYSDFGSTRNPKVGLQWNPVADVAVRGSYGTSFKAPLFSQLVGTQAYSTQTVPNASAPGGQSSIVYLSGANPTLQPETATTWSVGAEWQPVALPGVSLGATYFSVDYAGRILSLTTTDLASVLSRDDLYGPLVTRGPTATAIQSIYSSPYWSGSSPQLPIGQITAIVDGRLRNVGVVKQNGFDIGLKYGFDTEIGSFALSANLTWLTSYKVARSSSAPQISFLATYGNPNDIRLRAGANWHRDALDAALYVNYVNGYDNPAGTPVTKVDSWATVDLQFRYDASAISGFTKGLSVTLSAQNVFDASPPFVNNLTGRYGFDPENANALGRVLSLNITKKW